MILENSFVNWSNWWLASVDLFPGRDDLPWLVINLKEWRFFHRGAGPGWVEVSLGPFSLVWLADATAVISIYRSWR